MKLGTKGNIFLRTVSAVPIEVFVSCRTSGRVLNKMVRVTASQDTVIAAPPAEDIWISIRNDDTTLSHYIEVAFDAGKAQAFVLFARTLAAGESAIFTGSEWIVYTAAGVPYNSSVIGAPADTSMSTVILGADVINNDAVANTMKDVTGLSFSVLAGYTYWFRFVIPYTSAATTTGSRWAISGPAAPTQLNYTSRYTLTETTLTSNYASAYDIPAASNASSLTAGNVAIIEGVIVPSAAGTVIARFASEVSASAITAKAGAACFHQRVL